MISPVFASTRNSESYTRELTVRDAGSFARNGAKVLASAKVPSMSLPPRSGDTATVGAGDATGAAGWHPITTTTSTTSTLNDRLTLPSVRRASNLRGVIHG